MTYLFTFVPSITYNFKFLSNMKFSYNILVLLAASLFTACTTDINLDLNGTTPELVVDGAITTDTMAHSIVLKKTANYFQIRQPKEFPGQWLPSAMDKVPLH